MEISVIDNQKMKMVKELNSCIETSERIRFAIAFVKSSGYLLIKDSLEEFLRKDGIASILVGVDFNTSDPKTIRELHHMSQKHRFFEFLCFRGNIQQIATYHPKLYLFDQKNEIASAIIGSSNLTSGGLKNNIEVNIKITSGYDDEIFSDLSATFLQMKLLGGKFKPNDEYIDQYEELYRLVRKGKIIHNRPQFKKLRELESSLPRPEIQREDLVGWMKLVYEHLPEGEFSAVYLYQFVGIFKQKYPDNRHIRAKIRQQLQFLRNVGLLEYPSRDVWIKK